MVLIGGILIGIVIYILTVLPLALIGVYDPSNEVWVGVTTLYGVVCGFVGVTFMAARDL